MTGVVPHRSALTGELSTATTGERQVVMTDISTLNPRPANARTHSKRQIKAVAASISAFGFINPILVDGSGNIIAGHCRLEAAKLLELKQVPTVCVSHLSEAEIRAYVIADNKLAEQAGWNTEILAIELKELAIQFPGDIRVTGVTTPELDRLLISADPPADEPEVPAVATDRAPVSRPGDVWIMGRHRLACGDARDASAYEALMQGELATCVISDPPYDLKVAGHVSGLGKVRHREFVMASGEMSPAQFTIFLEAALRNLAKASRPGSLHYIFMDFRHIREIMDAGSAAYTEFKNLCVWVKSNGGMGSLYRSQFELVFVFKNGSEPHINNVELGKHGRNRTNVWHYAGMNSFGKGRDELLAMHPTVKPMAMIEDAIKDCSNRGDIVLDAFAGSGTGILAAENTGRRGYGIEADPHYVDLILTRFGQLGIEARHAETGMTFQEIAAVRSGEGA